MSAPAVTIESWRTVELLATFIQHVPGVLSVRSELTRRQAIDRSA